MAMQFYQANRPNEAPLTDAAFKQAEIAAALRQQAMAKKQMLGQAGVQFAGMVPKGAWGNLGNAIMGGGGAAAAPVVDAATGAVMSAAPAAANSAAALTAGAGGAAAAAPAAGGIAPALGGLGPMGWAALLAGGFLMKDMFKGGD